ncbi:TonB-dependent receptor [Aliidiomarina shirensis]|uniref:TonB-dependent receptor n=1 Tax=Aliidiomarina shirensis TaxID=1048642 RepID=A0A432WSM1_9GAMM|nr:TonB-dependent receptor [Aliidiomarina shirensis]RUO36771.1 TonB-dependent receptor [Aliidiomarina shirensis]
MKNRKLQLPLLGFSLSALTLAMGGALANEEDENTTQEAESNEKVERIQVTGSQIRGVDLEGAQPLITIGFDDIRNSSATTVSELLRDVGQTRGGEGSFSTFSSGALQGDSPVGQAAASLRGLGASSTLTLINGRRVTGSSFANNFENFVDINSIPLSAIERVDILATGASATYGADAIAGVINYVLRRDFEGAEVNISYGNSEASSNDGKLNVNVIAGKNYGDTNITAFFDYYDREPLYDRDRSRTANSFFPSQQGIYPSWNTRFFDDDDYVEATCPDDLSKSGAFGEYCEYNQNAVMPTYTALESYGAGIMLTHEFDSVTWFNELMFSRTEASSNSTAAPWSGYDVSFEHPDMPAELRDRFLDLWDSIGEAPLGEIRGWGRFADGRTISNETESLRLVSGLEGNWGSWFWEAAATYSESSSEQRAIAGIYNRARFEAALLGELCADGTTNCAPDENGLWYNPFGGQANNSEQVLGLLEEQLPRNGNSKLYGIDFRTSGDLYEMQNGILSAAFGVEARREEISDNPDPLARGTFENNYMPGVIGFGSTGAQASRDQWAAFAELFIPITERLNAQVAGRYDYYDDFGGEFNPKIGLRYEASDELVVRTSWAQSFRAPSLSQVGAEITLSSFNLECKEAFRGNYCGDTQIETNILTKVFGNEDLEAEDSESFSAGFAWSPNRDITFTADYWRFEHNNIVGVDGEFMLLRSLSDPSLRFCGELPANVSQGIGFEECDENGVGIVTSRLAGDVHLQLENLGKQTTQGVDLTYTQYFEVDGIASFTWLVDFTHLLNFDRQLSQNAEEEALAGSFRYPRTVVTNTLRWDREEWFGNLRVQYTSGYDDDIEAFQQSDLDRLGISANRKVPSWTKVNATVGYEISENITLRFNIENLFDRQAPFAYGTSANVDHFNHDTMGRFYRLSATYRY